MNGWMSGWEGKEEEEEESRGGCLDTPDCIDTSHVKCSWRYILVLPLSDGREERRGEDRELQSSSKKLRALPLMVIFLSDEWRRFDLIWPWQSVLIECSAALPLADWLSCLWFTLPFSLSLSLSLALHHLVLAEATNFTQSVLRDARQFCEVPCLISWVRRSLDRYVPIDPSSPLLCNCSVSWLVCQEESCLAIPAQVEAKNSLLRYYLISIEFWQLETPSYPALPCPTLDPLLRFLTGRKPPMLPTPTCCNSTQLGRPAGSVRLWRHSFKSDLRSRILIGCLKSRLGSATCWKLRKSQFTQE